MLENSVKHLSCNITESRQVILDSHPQSDQHQNPITYRRSSLAMPTKFGQHP